MNDQWMTVKEVAAYLKLSTDLIYRFAQQGKIPASRVGGRWRFNRKKIDKWMDAQSVAEEEPARASRKS